jgi:hypothetical protein
MSATAKRPDTAMTPETAGIIADYFVRVRSALPADAPAECEEMVEDLRAHVLEELAGDAGDSADVTRILAKLGQPEAIAAQCAEAAQGDPSGSQAPEDKRSALYGRVLGVPYDLRLPTAERVASRWWNPLDPRVFTPRLFGIGWTINFASIAVRLGIIRPDDEDVPFGLVPKCRLIAALVLPLALAAGLAALIVVFQPTLPALIPVHYTTGGRTDRFAAKWTALAMPAAMTALGMALAAWTWIRRRPPLSRVAAGALATALAALSIGGYGQQVAAANGSDGTVFVVAGLAAALLLPFALLVILSRIGRAAEQKRDLEAAKNNGGSI